MNMDWAEKIINEWRSKPCVGEHLIECECLAKIITNIITHALRETRKEESLRADKLEYEVSILRSKIENIRTILKDY